MITQVGQNKKEWLLNRWYDKVFYVYGCISISLMVIAFALQFINSFITSLLN